MMQNYSEKLALLQKALIHNPGVGFYKLYKNTISNLFRYDAKLHPAAEAIPKRHLDLSTFNHILNIDSVQQTLDVEGLTTYESIVQATLPHGFLPTVTPELKHITIGGAIVGIGIESSSYRYGFVHDGLLEADVLLPNGNIVTATPHNEYQDLFHGLPNSYGTLGYILRAKIKLMPATPWVQLNIHSFNQLPIFLEALYKATQDSAIQFVEGLFFNDHRYYLMLGKFMVPTTSPTSVTDIVREHIFYKHLQTVSEMILKTEDYIFRYDYEWFWNIPHTPFYQYFRRYAPLSWRNSAFYTRYSQLRQKLQNYLPISSTLETEPLIQDWQVPWNESEKLITETLKTIDLKDRPWVAVPIHPRSTPSLYPVKSELYFNLGCYCQIPNANNDFAITRHLDEYCRQLSGIKMLYSSTFMDQNSFYQQYGGEAYYHLKKQYDPQRLLPELYDKVAKPYSTKS